MRLALSATLACNICTMLIALFLAMAMCVGVGMARGDVGPGVPRLPPPSALESVGIILQVLAMFLLIQVPSIILAWRGRYRLAFTTALPPLLIGATSAWILRYAFL